MTLKSELSDVNDVFDGLSEKVYDFSVSNFKNYTLQSLYVTKYKLDISYTEQSLYVTKFINAKLIRN